MKVALKAARCISIVWILWHIWRVVSSWTHNHSERARIEKASSITQTNGISIYKSHRNAGEKSLTVRREDATLLVLPNRHLKRCSLQCHNGLNPPGREVDEAVEPANYNQVLTSTTWICTLGKLWERRQGTLTLCLSEVGPFGHRIQSLSPWIGVAQFHSRLYNNLSASKRPVTTPMLWGVVFPLLRRWCRCQSWRAKMLWPTTIGKSICWWCKLTVKCPLPDRVGRWETGEPVTHTRQRTQILMV